MLHLYVCSTARIFHAITASIMLLLCLNLDLNVPCCVHIQFQYFSLLHSRSSLIGFKLDSLRSLIGKWALFKDMIRQSSVIGVLENGRCDVTPISSPVLPGFCGSA